MMVLLISSEFNLIVRPGRNADVAELPEFRSHAACWGKKYQPLKPDDPNLLYTRDRRDVIVDRHGIKSIPLMMIDHQGEIRHVHQGYGESKLDQIIDELKALLVEQAQHRRGS